MNVTATSRLFEDCSNRVRSRLPINWLQLFVIAQIGCQLALLVPGIGPLRVPMRVAAYGISLTMLMLSGRRARPHAASIPAMLVLFLLTLEFLHPEQNSWLAAIAQVGLYAAILAPVWWVPRLQVSYPLLRQVLLTIWVFHTLSSAVGVLQMHFPGQFQPQLSAVTEGAGAWYVADLHITLANGSRVLRPMGLTDIPGGAATAGSYALLFGVGLFLVERSVWIRLACVGSMATGLFCLYLSQQRVAIVMAAICALVFVGLLASRGDFSGLWKSTAILALVIMASFGWAVAVGGDAATGRLATLIQDDPGTVYYKNRGHFLVHTLEVLLPAYPLGAGLGRWGMTHHYLGNRDSSDSPSIWVEVQWTGWLLDGGVPLIITYVVALLIAMGLTARVALRRGGGNLQPLAALIFAYDVGVLAATFNYSVFIGQNGLEFWLLNAAVVTAAHAQRSTRASAR